MSHCVHNYCINHSTCGTMATKTGEAFVRGIYRQTAITSCARQRRNNAVNNLLLPWITYLSQARMNNVQCIVVYKSHTCSSGYMKFAGFT